MKESEIRPENLMQENAALQIEDVQRLLTLADEFVEISCPACESRHYDIRFQKSGFTFVSCKECETLFINPRPTREMLAEYYGNARSLKHWNDCIFPMTEASRRAQIFAPRASRVVELCRKHGVATGTLLDVGAGFGTFCEEMMSLNVFDEVIAVEASHEMAETCRRRGISVIEGPIESVELDRRDVSVVSNFELIEHLFWPREFLLACAQALSLGGMLILTTPNIKGFDLLVLGALSDNVDGPNHLNYFHPSSLARLLEVCGFELMEMLTPGKLDAELVRSKILDGQLDVGTHPFLKHILVDTYESNGQAFQRFLAANGLSSHLWVVARKVA